MSSINYKLNFARLTTKCLHYFYDTKSIISDEIEILLEKGVPIDKQDPQGLITKYEKKFLKDKEIFDNLELEEKVVSEKGIKIIESISIIEKYNRTLISFDIKEEVFTIFQDFGRNTRLTTRNVGVDKSSEFELKNKFIAYENEPYTFALVSEKENYGIAFSVCSGKLGIKGDNILKVIEFTENTINVDNGSKYFDVSILIKNVSI